MVNDDANRSIINKMCATESVQKFCERMCMCVIDRTDLIDCEPPRKARVLLTGGDHCTSIKSRVTKIINNHPVLFDLPCCDL